MKNAQTTMHTSSCAKHMQSYKSESTVRGVEFKCTMVDVLVDRHSERWADRPILIVSFYYNVERQPG